MGLKGGDFNWCRFWPLGYAVVVLVEIFFRLALAILSAWLQQLQQPMSLKQPGKKKTKRQKVLEIPYRKYINNNDLVACRYVQNAEKIALLSRDRSDSESTLSKDCTMGPIKNSRNSFKSCPKYFQTVSIFHFLTCVLIKSIFYLFLFTYIYKLKNSDTTSKRLRNTLWELLDKAHHQELIF